MQANSAIYLDANAGAPLHPRVRQELRSLLEDASALFSNPSSTHALGQDARKRIASARERVAHSLGSSVSPDQITFTASGTESNQLAIRSILVPLLESGSRPHWITTPVEHDCTLQMAEWIRARGGEVSLIPVDSCGRPIPSALSELIRPETALISVIWVNNETGAISDAASFAAICRERRVPLHLDGAQAWGKIPFDLSTLGADLVSFSGHKIGGLPGTGVLYARDGVKVGGLLRGKQEKGRRGGTENSIGIIALGIAASETDPAGYRDSLAPFRDALEKKILERIPGVIVNGAGAPRVANTLSISFRGLASSTLVLELDLAGFCVSAGSACASGSPTPSHVLTAMGRSREEALASLRISLPKDAHAADLERFADALIRIVLRGQRSERQAFGENRIHSS
jgi:cysteine desulfurase